MENGRTHSLLPWRLTFALAAGYNLAFGAWAVIWPGGFFELFDLAPPNYPGIWSCLGMVIGVYGLGYAYVAWKPAHGDVIALLGLIGKVLGPLGWLIAVGRGDLAARTLPLIVLNDLVWWYPFLAYLLRRAARRKAVIVTVVVLVHLVALTMLLLVRGGTEAQSDLAARAVFIEGSSAMWVVCWFLWTVASLGLMAFFIAWASRLAKLRAQFPLLAAFCAVALVGLACDLASETILVSKLTEWSGGPDQFATWARRATLLGAGLGNGCYCIAGLGMSILAWQVGLHRGMLFISGLAVWTAGFLLSIAAFTDSATGMTTAGAALMLLFIPWAAIVGSRFDSYSKRSIGP